MVSGSPQFAGGRQRASLLVRAAAAAAAAAATAGYCKHQRQAAASRSTQQQAAGAGSSTQQHQGAGSSTQQPPKRAPGPGCQFSYVSNRFPTGFRPVSGSAAGNGPDTGRPVTQRAGHGAPSRSTQAAARGRSRQQHATAASSPAPCCLVPPSHRLS